MVDLFRGRRFRFRGVAGTAQQIVPPIIATRLLRHVRTYMPHHNYMAQRRNLRSRLVRYRFEQDPLSPAQTAIRSEQRLGLGIV